MTRSPERAPADARPDVQVAPKVHHRPELLLKAQGVAIAFFEVDGVLTDGGLHLSPKGENLNRIYAQDAYGLELLQTAGIAPAILTRCDSRPLRLRLKALGIRHAHFAVQDKCVAAQTVLDGLGLQWEQAAAMGDDWPDLPLMRRCAFAAAPSGAHREVRAVADYVSARRGGDGAVRDLCDVLLVASGKYAGLLEDGGS